eukprot:gene10611-12550_t
MSTTRGGGRGTDPRPNEELFGIESELGSGRPSESNNQRDSGFAAANARDRTRDQPSHKESHKNGRGESQSFGLNEELWGTDREDRPERRDAAERTGDRDRRPGKEPAFGTDEDKGFGLDAELGDPNERNKGSGSGGRDDRLGSGPDGRRGERTEKDSVESRGFDSKAESSSAPRRLAKLPGLDNVKTEQKASVPSLPLTRGARPGSNENLNSARSGSSAERELSHRSEGRERSRDEPRGSKRPPPLKIDTSNSAGFAENENSSVRKSEENILNGGYLHIMGQLLGAEGYNRKTVYCQWRLVFGHGWTPIKGEISGQTHMASPDDDTEFSVWSQPINVTFSAKTIQGWPRVMVKVYEHGDWIGMDSFLAYGLCYIPVQPGRSDLVCQTWRANDRISRLKHDIVGFFTGQRPELDPLIGPADEAQYLTGCVICGGREWHSQAKEEFITARDEAYTATMVTIGSGRVHLELSNLFQGRGWHNIHL